MSRVFARPGTGALANTMINGSRSWQALRDPRRGNTSAAGATSAGWYAARRALPSAGPRSRAFSRRQAGGPRRFMRRQKATSSMSAISGKPGKASRRTKIAWSPVAMPVRRERRFIAQATTFSSGWRPSISTSNLPQRCSFNDAWTSSSACGGRRVSACRKSSISPVAARAAAFICSARPRGAFKTWVTKAGGELQRCRRCCHRRRRSPRGRARAAERAPRARRGCRAPRSARG